jgi:hypothetical protein
MPNDLADSSDAGLIRRALGGDQTAVSALIDRHVDAVHAECQATLAVEHVALDAVHAVFVRAGACLSKLADRSRLREWLLAIARHEIAGRRQQSEFARTDVSPERTGHSFSRQLDYAVPASFRHRMVVDMMVALGFGPVVPAASSDFADLSLSLRSAELWPIALVDEDNWEWMLDGFPLDPNRAAPLPRLLLGATVAAAIALLAGLLIFPLLRSDVDVQVAGIVESTDDVARAIAAGEFRIYDDETSRQLSEDSPDQTFDESISPATTPLLPGESASSDSGGASGTTEGGTPIRQPDATTGSAAPIEPTTTTTAVTLTSTTALTDATSTTSVIAVAPTISVTTGATTSVTTTTPVTTTSATTTSTTTTSTTSTSTTSTTSTTTTTTTLAPNVGPTVSAAQVAPGSVRVSDGNCISGTATISADVTDSDGSVVAVVAEWSANGQDTISTPLNDLGDGTFEALVGPWFVVGTHTVVVVATDGDGAEAQGSDIVRVRRCPGS